MRTRWWSGKAIGLHLTMLLVASGCLAAGWWMFSRATHGDGVAWVYTVEWPFFAGYAVYMWWKLLHDDPEARRAAMRSAAVSTGPGGAGDTSADGPALGSGGSRTEASEGVPVPAGFDPYDESDPELAAYNRYLASLHARDRRPA